MEGWFPSECGDQTRLRIADAAERHPELDDESQGELSGDPTARLPQPELTRTHAAHRKAPPNAGVDAGRKPVPVTREVSLDILLHGRNFKPRFRSDSHILCKLQPLGRRIE